MISLDQNQLLNLLHTIVWFATAPCCSRTKATVSHVAMNRSSDRMHNNSWVTLEAIMWLNYATNVLYGGSFRRFMQVADVGKRSACSSIPGTPALHSSEGKK